jgi:AraC-like DNA-binding protein
VFLPFPDDAEPKIPRQAAKHVMWLSPDRAVYSGLLGQPVGRTFGGYACYFTMLGPHRIQIEDGPWQACQLSFVPPYLRHNIAADGQTICGLLVEAETVDEARRPDLLRRGAGPVVDAQSHHRMREGMARLLRQMEEGDVTDADVDHAFFGERLAAPVRDTRIQNTLDRIKAAPRARVSALECAERICLSESRFLRLFSHKVGVPFRQFKAWKRARIFLSYVTQDLRLTDVALDAGYPDASHFSHSIRDVFGLTPRSIVSGSRRLSLFGEGDASAPGEVAPPPRA